MADYKRQVNTNIKFEDKSLNNPTSFYWNFGDGTAPITTPDKIVYHKYVSEGIYNIIHKASNDCGINECITKRIEITTEAPPKELGIITVVVAGIGLGILYFFIKK